MFHATHNRNADTISNGSGMNTTYYWNPKRIMCIKKRLNIEVLRKKGTFTLSIKIIRDLILKFSAQKSMIRTLGRNRYHKVLVAPVTPRGCEKLNDMMVEYDYTVLSMTHTYG